MGVRYLRIRLTCPPRTPASSVPRTRTATLFGRSTESRLRSRPHHQCRAATAPRFPTPDNLPARDDHDCPNEERPPVTAAIILALSGCSTRSAASHAGGTPTATTQQPAPDASDASGGAKASDGNGDVRSSRKQQSARCVLVRAGFNNGCRRRPGVGKKRTRRTRTSAETQVQLQRPPQGACR